jgi:hypothetical protein
MKGIPRALVVLLALLIAGCGQPLQTGQPSSTSQNQSTRPTQQSSQTTGQNETEAEQEFGDPRIQPAIDPEELTLEMIAVPQPDDACIVIIPPGATWVEPSGRKHFCFMSQQADVNGHVIEQEENGGDFAMDTSSPEKIKGNYVQTADGEHPVYARDTSDGLAKKGDTCYWIGEKPGTYRLSLNSVSTEISFLPSPDGGFEINGGTLPLKVDKDKVAIVQINQQLVEVEDQGQDFVPGTLGRKVGFALLVHSGTRDGKEVYERVANFTFEDIRDSSGNLASDGTLDTIKILFHEGIKIQRVE